MISLARCAGPRDGAAPRLWHTRVGDETLTRLEALHVISDHSSELDRFHVRSLSLFGSVARDEALPESDVDVLVEFTEPVGLFEFVRLRRFLESLFGRRVDLATAAALKPRVRERVLAEAVRAP